MSPFASEPSATIAALGEVRLIAAIRGWLGRASPPEPFGIGDDCAALPVFRRQPLVTVDPVIYGEHFDDQVSPEAAGAKLLKRNLSDIAAMGGRPRAAVIALALDEKVSLAWLRGFYRGLARAALAYRVPIVGGDIAHQAGGVVATLTLLGEAVHSRILTRRGARVGDRIYVTGKLGGSLLGHHLTFRPRLAEGAWLAARTEVTALLDLSDGLAKDIHALTPPGAEPHLKAAAIPIAAAARRLARETGRKPLDHAVDDGEDYELLFVVSARADAAVFERAWRRRFPTRLTCLGRFQRIGTAPDPADLDLASHHGFEHLR